MKLLIGCSGWQYPEWKGIFYPADLPKSKWFEFYCQHFNTVEINYTFYHLPSTQTLKRWQQIAPNGFIYSIKANRLITHYKRFVNTQNIINDFYSQLELLKEKLGPILFQLPENFHYSEEHLERVVKQLNNNYKNVIEFRHGSWLNPIVQKTLQENKIAFCAIDAPGLPREIFELGNIFYLRFHGKKYWYKDDYSQKELNEWVNKINQRRFKEIYIYFNNTMKSHAPFNALKIKELF